MDTGRNQDSSQDDAAEESITSEPLRYGQRDRNQFIRNGTGNYYMEAQTRDARRTDLIVDYAGEQFIVGFRGDLNT